MSQISSHMCCLFLFLPLNLAFPCSFPKVCRGYMVVFLSKQAATFFSFFYFSVNKKVTCFGFKSLSVVSVLVLCFPFCCYLKEKYRMQVFMQAFFGYINLFLEFDIQGTFISKLQTTTVFSVLIKEQIKVYYTALKIFVYKTLGALPNLCSGIVASLGSLHY